MSSQDFGAAVAGGAPTVGETLFVTVCDLAEGRAAQLLPRPLKPLRDQAFFYLVWATLNADAFPLRHRTFFEANIALPCEGPEGEGTWFFKAYFPGHHMVRHANLSGWSGEQAEVSIGRVPLSIQRFVWPPEHPVGGWVGLHGRRHFEMELSLGREVTLADTPLAFFNRVYGVREFGSRRDVTLEEHLGEDVIARVLEADSQLQLSDELAQTLGVRAYGRGYLLELGIVLGGSHRVG